MLSAQRYCDPGVTLAVKSARCKNQGAGFGLDGTSRGVRAVPDEVRRGVPDVVRPGVYDIVSGKTAQSQSVWQGRRSTA